MQWQNTNVVLAGMSWSYSVTLWCYSVTQWCYAVTHWSYGVMHWCYTITVVVYPSTLVRDGITLQCYVKPGTDLPRGKSRRAEVAAARCVVQIKLHFCFASWDKSRADPQARCVHDVHILHAWMLASAVCTANRAKCMSTLRTYRVLPHFDGLTANGLGHTSRWGRSCHAA